MSDSNHDFCVVLTTTNDDENKHAIIKALLSKQLAACIQEIPMTSHYVWQEEVCHDSETLLVIKSKKSLYTLVEESIRELHNYEVPQIVQLDIAVGFQPYLSWIAANTLETQKH
ncbi:divalent-cation tolerance protein CutA [Vibrio vulnificus]|uniref:divalent-cation tolerance protein CutA n=1 Tax=Vibrio vulnificus TaxID=672 RepID=UPI003241CB78